MSYRLKQDILKEAARYGGLIQVQEEVDGIGRLRNTFASYILRLVGSFWF